MRCCARAAAGGTQPFACVLITTRTPSAFRPLPDCPRPAPRASALQAPHFKPLGLDLSPLGPHTMSQQALDELALLVVHNLPQALFVALVAFVVALVLKDFINGMARRPFLNPDKCGARGGRWAPAAAAAAAAGRGHPSLSLTLPLFTPPSPPPPFQPRRRWQPLTLVDIKELSHNTKRFRFALPHQEQALGLPLGQHISIKATDAEGRDVMRCVAWHALAAPTWYLAGCCLPWAACCLLAPSRGRRHTRGAPGVPPQPTPTDGGGASAAPGCVPAALCCPPARLWQHTCTALAR